MLRYHIGLTLTGMLLQGTGPTNNYRRDVNAIKST